MKEKYEAPRLIKEVYTTDTIASSKSYVGLLGDYCAAGETSRIPGVNFCMV